MLRRAASCGSTRASRARPSFEYVLVLVSFSQTLNCSIFVSMSFRAVASARLSLTCAEDNRGSGARNVTEIARVEARRPTSLDAAHVLIWSRWRCSFLISFLRSTSYFSFWFCCVAL